MHLNKYASCAAAPVLHHPHTSPALIRSSPYTLVNLAMKKFASLCVAMLVGGLSFSALASDSTSSGRVVELKPDGVLTIQSMLNAESKSIQSIVRVSAANFVAGSGQITFSEFPLATGNPSYTPANYGGGPASPSVSFRGFFAGQSLGAPATCPPGAAVSGCVIGTATSPLTLAPASPSTSIVSDGSNPTSPVLSGSPLFNGPIAILFSSNQAAVGLSGGFFDSVGSTAITAFRRDGTVIGSISNTITGIEFLGLATADNSETIAGLLFSLVGAESAGFAIDNLRFGTAGQVVIPGAPVAPVLPIPINNPTALFALILAMGLLSVVVIRRLG